MRELDRLWVVVKYEFLKQYRRRRFYGAMIVVVLAVVLSAAMCEGWNLLGRMGIPSWLLEEKGAELFAIWVSSMSAFALLAAVFFSGDALASEFERGTGYLLFPNPVGRGTLVLGKYLACLLATVLVLGTGFFLSALLTLAFYGRVPLGMAGSFGVTLAIAVFVNGMAFAFSSSLKGGTGATVATLLTYMVLFSTVSTGLSYAGHEPWFMPDRASDAMASTYGVSFEEAFGGMMGGGQAMGRMVRASEDPVVASLLLTGYGLGLLGFSVWRFRRREMA
ncbi:MAG: ABC transporter permease [Candidatus Hadarchaeales archaeon]